MKLFKFTANVTISLIIGGLIAVFATFPDTFFPLLSLDRSKLAQGEAWRIITGNFVHFGWVHTLMNIAAFMIFAFALANAFSTARFITLILFCGAAVGVGVYCLNPEYEIYAGLSGAIHGFFVAGLLANKRHALWLNSIFIAVLFGKVLIEHRTNYHATELQSLLPVAVAYDAHLYGALAGLAFAVSNLALDKVLRK
jgi:rhomboid family GlyGly-CTERM serine protease